MSMIPKPNVIAPAQMAPVSNAVYAARADQLAQLERSKALRQNIFDATEGLGKGYMGYMDITGHNPLGDLVGKWTGRTGGLDPIDPAMSKGIPTEYQNREWSPDEAMDLLRGKRPDTMGTAPRNMPAPDPTITTGSTGGGASNLNVGVDPAQYERMRGLTASTGGYPGAGYAPNLSGLPEASQITGVPKTAAAAVQPATQGASQAAQAAGKGLGAASKVMGPIGAAAGIANAFNEPGASDERIAGKTVGNAAAGALPYTTGPLLAAGPVGWAGLAAQGLAALYGMLG